MPQRGWAIPNPTHMEARTTSPLTRLQQFCRTHRQTLLQTYVAALPSSSYLLSLGTGPATPFQLLSGSILQLPTQPPSPSRPEKEKHSRALQVPGHFISPRVPLKTELFLLLPGYLSFSYTSKKAPQPLAGPWHQNPSPASALSRFSSRLQESLSTELETPITYTFFPDEDSFL